MEVGWLIKTVAAVGLEHEDAETAQITNAAISEQGYRGFMWKEDGFCYQILEGCKYKECGDY